MFYKTSWKKLIKEFQNLDKSSNLILNSLFLYRTRNVPHIIQRSCKYIFLNFKKHVFIKIKLISLNKKIIKLVYYK